MGTLKIMISTLALLFLAVCDAGKSIKPDPYDSTFLHRRSAKTLAELHDWNNTHARNIIDRIGSTFVMSQNSMFSQSHTHTRI